MGPRSILIIGNYGAGNLGDDAILGGILEDLKAVGYKEKVEVMHGGFHSSQEIYKQVKEAPFVPAGLKSFFSRKRRKAALAAIKRADMVILGGGGLFTDGESGKAPLIWAIQAFAVMKMNKPYICYGQSVGPIKSWFARFLTKRVFAGAKAVCVRDHQSAKLLEQLGVEGVFIGTDPALSWFPGAIAGAKKGLGQKEDVLAISLRSYTKQTRKLWQPIIDGAVAFAKKKKLKPIVIAMDIRNKKELKELRATGLEVFEPPSASLALQGFLKAKYAITMRLHAGIFAIAAKDRMLALSYSSKVAGFFSNYPIEVIDLENFSRGKLKRSLKNLASQKRPSINLAKAIHSNQDFLARALDLHQ